MSTIDEDQRSEKRKIEDAALIMRFKLEDRFEKHKGILDETSIGIKPSPYYNVKKLEQP